MLILISPAKKLDGSSPPPVADHSTPQFLARTGILIQELRKLSHADLRRLLQLSPKLADIAFERHLRLSTEPGPANAKQAVFAFAGDTYIGLRAHSLSRADLAFAQDHLRIFSALYGLLRPLDLMQPYRLEMATKLPNPSGGDLYDFWEETLGEAVNNALGRVEGPMINLASREYFSAIKKAQPSPGIITPVFKEERGGSYRVLPLFAKRARGMMARYIVQNRLREVESLKNFDRAGYRFSPEASSQTELVFLRDQG
ncbi:MAG: peroxide stress protein YaaA [Sphingomonadales bacterium]